MTSVLVVDDQAVFRAGLGMLLDTAPGVRVAGLAADGADAVRQAARLRPEVILMDIRMPGMSGIAATEQILAQAGEPVPKVIMLTTFDLDVYVYAALRAGASGFLLKEEEPERIIAAIGVVAAGDMLFAPPVVRRMVEAYATRLGQAEKTPADLSRLTCRETEVLRLVGRGLPNSEIAVRLAISEATVKTHLNRVMTKLALSSRAQCVVVAYETRLVVPNAGESAPRP